MKTIKQSKVFNPDEQIKNLFSSIQLSQIIISLSILVWSFFRTCYSYLHLTSTSNNPVQSILQNYGLISILTIHSLPDFWFFLGASVTDFHKQQKRIGTLNLILSFLVRSHIVLAFHFIVKEYITSSYPSFNQFKITSIPIQYLIMISVSSSINKSGEMTYIFIKPFQIKNIIKPLLYVVIIQLQNIRLDQLLTIMVQIILNVIKIDKALFLICKKIQKLYPQLNKLNRYRGMNTLKTALQFKQLDIIKTNNSIVLQQK